MRGLTTLPGLDWKGAWPDYITRSRLEGTLPGLDWKGGRSRLEGWPDYITKSQLEGWPDYITRSRFEGCVA